MTEISLNEFNNRPKPQPTWHTILRSPRTGLIAGAVIVAVLSFGAGMAYQKSKHDSPATQSATRRGAAGQFSGRFQRGNRAVGTVTAVSSSAITLQTRTGATATYTITSSTTVTTSGQPASISAVQVGDLVFITLDSSNTQDAKSIMDNPGFGGGANTNNSGSSTTSPQPTNATSTSAVST